MEPEWMLRLPPDVLALTKKLVRVSRQMLQERLEGRLLLKSSLLGWGKPSGEVRRWLKIAKEGIDPGETG